MEVSHGLIGLCELRTSIYTFFSSLLYREIDEEVYERLDTLPLLLKAFAELVDDEHLEREAGDFEGYIKALKRDHDRDTMILEFARSFAALFLSVSERSVPVWESVYLGRRRLMCQEPFFSVKDFYSKYGLMKREDFREPDDHIALELYFLKALGERLCDKLRECEHEEALELLRAQAEFLDKHLLAWAPRFAELVIKNDGLGFYARLSSLLVGFLRADRTFLDEARKTLSEACYDTRLPHG